MAGTLSPKRKLALYGIMLAILLIAAEILCFSTFIAGKDALRILTIDPELEDPKRIEEYLAMRDDLLGWAPTNRKEMHVDRTRARYSPAFPQPGSACLSVYGDSFAWGSDVSDEEAWANVLATKLGCRVANYGVPGYGTDQALLRFEQTTEDEAPEVVLSIYPDNVLRCLTQVIGLVVLPSVDYRGLKPRFVLDANGTLELKRIPYSTKEELLAYAKDPIAALQEDWFNPTGHYARNRYVRFPYTYSMFELLTGEQFLSILERKRTGTPALLPYYQPGHPSRSQELILAIIARFDAEAKKRGKKLFVMILPDQELMAHHASFGTWAHADLLERAAQIAPMINMGQGFAEALKDRPYESIMHPGGHYTAEGNRMIAEYVQQALAREKARQQDAP